MPNEQRENLLILILVSIFIISLLFFDFDEEMIDYLSSTFYIYQRAPVSLQPTTQPQFIEIEILYSGEWKTQANHGDPITAPVFINNPSLESINLTHITLGNQENNNFLSYIEPDSYTIEYTDSKGVHTSQLKDTGANSLNGFRIFYITPYAGLARQSTREYKVSAKLKDYVPIKYLKLELSSISGYAGTSKLAIKTRGSLSAKINILNPGQAPPPEPPPTQINATLNIEVEKSQYNLGEQVKLK